MVDDLPHLLPGCLLGALMAPVGGRIFDRFGAKKPILLGHVLMVTSTALFALLAQNMTLTRFIFLYLGFAIGLGFNIGNTIANGLRQLPKELVTDGNAAINTCQQLAGVLGTAVVAALVTAAQASPVGSFAEATLTGSRQAFILLFFLAALAWGCSLGGI